MTEVEYWWEPRRLGELTTEFLGRVLDEVALHKMASQARRGNYDDFFEPEETADGLGALRLVEELTEAAQAPQTKRNDRPRIRAMIEGVKDGVWDATREESDRWAASKAGQETFAKLLHGPGENRAPADSQIGAAWISVSQKLAAMGGRTASQGGEADSNPYEAVTAASGLDPDDAGRFVVGVAENVLATAGLSPEVYPVLTGAIWGALLTGVEVAND